MGYKIHWTDEKLDKLTTGYTDPFKTVAKIALELGIDPSSVGKKAAELGLKKAVALHKWTPAKIEFAKANAGKMALCKIGEAIGISEDSVHKLLIREGVTDRIPKGTVYKAPMTDEFMNDLANPRFSAPDLARKYGVSDVLIQQRRKKFYGKFKLQLDTIKRMSTAELEFQSLLDELDIAYFIEKKIGRYSIDFYLGQQKCVEVDGVYWHKSEKAQRSRVNKLRFLNSKGYTVLEVSEGADREETKLKVQQLMGLPTEKSVVNKRCEPLTSGCAERC